MIRSDLRNKEIALGRIKRLASSGLPLEPFARTIFELFHDAIAHGYDRAMGVSGDQLQELFFASTPEVVAMVPNFTYCAERPEIPGRSAKIH